MSRFLYLLLALFVGLIACQEAPNRKLLLKPQAQQ